LEANLRSIDFSSWQSLLTTFLGLAVFTLIGVGVRLIAMMTIQQRRERQNRQINERLRTLIAAYKVLGGSFTGSLSVDPSHLRDVRRPVEAAHAAETELTGLTASAATDGSDRARRIRDAVEAALSDIILLGTEEQVKLAADAAHELVAGRPVPTHALVVSLRSFIRAALDLDPIGADIDLPIQGPTRPASAGSRNKSENGGERSGQGNGGMGGGGIGGGGIDPSGRATPGGTDHKP
jgi:uncharacterized membrane protein YgcG